MRILALIEVVIACCLCFFAYRALQQTPLGTFEREVGRSYLPGCTMLALGFTAVLIHRRGSELFGITASHWRHGVIVGLASTLLFVLIGGGILLLGFPPSELSGTVVRVLGWLIGALLILCLFNSPSLRHPGRFAGPRAAAMGPCLLVGLLSLPLILECWSRQPMLTTVCGVAWLFVLTGFGEEFFFRGYVQSRLNFTFGRPYRLLGMDFGPGLVIASVLFGAMHVVNTVDPFQSRFEFAWVGGVVSVFSGICYGCLREKTGSILAGAIAHGLAGAMTE